jgi:hypothetical protein
MNGRLARIPALLLVCVGMACSEPPSTPSSGKHGATFDLRSMGTENLIGVEREFAAIADSVPEFAGFYYNATGTLVVRLVSSSPDALTRIIAQLQNRGRRVQPHVEQPASYRFLQLVEWRQAIRAVLPAGVYSLDLDEVSNTLQLGVSDLALGASIRSLASSLGIPMNAIDIVKSPAPELRSTLRDKIRPLRGGLQISWENGGLCTLMISGLSPTATSGYFTASHCSQVYAGPDGGDGTLFSQPIWALVFIFGGEGNDPPAFSGGSCAAGRVCRNADILFIGADGATTGGNTIFKPTGAPVAGGPGSITIAGTFTVTSGPPAAVGDSLQKVGRTSGWTKGAIQSTCVDKFTGELKAGQQLWILCNDVSSVWSEDGDSGSPMFRPSGQNVQLLGILWGGPSNNFNETWHSPCANIAQDLPFYQAFCS